MLIEIIPTQIEHIKELLKELKKINEEDAYRFGECPLEILIKAYKKSLYVKTAVVDGKIIAIWGIVGNYLGAIGRPWSLMLPDTENYPFRVTSFYRQEVDKMLELFPVLEDIVDIRHTKILRMLKIMGFTFGEPQEMNDGIFIKAERKACRTH